MTPLPQHACAARRFVLVLTFASLLAFSFCAGGIAQTALGAPRQTASVAAEQQLASSADLSSPETIRIADGTSVYLLVTETISSKTAKPGDIVKLQVFGEVKVGNLVVIVDKTPVLGTIESVKSARRAWRAGRLFLRLNTVTLLNQQQQPLRTVGALKGAATGAAGEWTEAVVQTQGLFLFGLPFAPLQHGNEAVLRRGSILGAEINGDILLPRSEIEARQPQSAAAQEPAETRHGPATVTFYYPDFGRGPFLAHIWCGEIEIGALRRGGRFTVSLPAARYFLRFSKKGYPVVAPLDVQEGGEQYVAVKVFREPAIGDANVSWLPHFSVVPHDVGELQSLDTSSAKSIEVRDISKHDLSRLQAEPSAK